MDKGKDRQAAVKDARLRWETAPAHVRALAGGYVGPVLTVLEAISEELDAIRQLLEGVGHAQR